MVDIDMSAIANDNYKPTLNDVHKFLEEYIVGEHESRLATFTNWILGGKNCMLSGQRSSGKTFIVDNYTYEFLYDLPYMMVVRDLLPLDPVIVDCGANCGNHTIFYASFSKKVYAIEPIKSSFDILLKGLSLNKIKNVVPFNMAISAREQNLKVVSINPYDSGSTAFNYAFNNNLVNPIDLGFKPLQHPTEDYFVESKPLDFVIHGKVDYIKIDVEGMEMEVLKGAEKIINEFHPLMLVEVWGRHKENLVLFKQWMKENDYFVLRKTRGPNYLIKYKKEEAATICTDRLIT